MNGRWYFAGDGTGEQVDATFIKKNKIVNYLKVGV